jgi:arylsulfatase A-like enzyme
MRFLLLLVCSALAMPLTSQAQQQPERPNIIVFLVDDLGWQDTSVPFFSSKTPFNQRYHTPNMERMAQSGLKFTQAYATAVCSPSRVSYLTGMNAARHRVTNWTLHANEIKSMETNHKTLDMPFWNVNGLSVEGVPNSVKAEPLPKRLAEAGYTTIHCGKAHFGALGTPGEDPLNWVFRLI